MKTFNVPITHPYIQQLTEADLSFIEWSTAFDNPAVLKKYQNTIYDDEFDEWYNEAIQEERETLGDDSDSEDEYDEESHEDDAETTQLSGTPREDDNFFSMGDEQPFRAVSDQNLSDDPDDWEEVT